MYTWNGYLPAAPYLLAIYLLLPLLFSLIRSDAIEQRIIGYASEKWTVVCGGEREKKRKRKKHIVFDTYRQ